MRFVFAHCLFIVVLLAPVAALAGDVRYQVVGVLPFPESFRTLDRMPSDAIPRPRWLDGTLWDQLVYWELHPVERALDNRRTRVLTGEQVRGMEVFFSFPDETQETIEAWRTNTPDIERLFRRITNAFTTYRWDGTLHIYEEERSLSDGRIRIRNGSPDEFSDPERTLAHAATWAYFHPDGSFARWAHTDIVFNGNPDLWPDPGLNPQEFAEAYFDVLAHEFGHALGFGHVDDPASLMNAAYSAGASWTDRESIHAQVAYEIGPGVQYPGFVPSTTTAPGDLKGGVKDLVDEALDDLQDDSDGRQATETVPALPAAGVLLLATLLALLGRRRLRAG